MVCLMGVPPFCIVVQSFILHRYSFSRNTICSVLSHFLCDNKGTGRRDGLWGNFALRRDLLLSTVTKVGKSTGRNLRFLHFRARYGAYRIVSTYHTFTQDFLFRFVKRIVSASAPLPLIPATNSAFGSTVDNVSGNGARRKSMRHTLRYQPCSVNARYNVTNLQGI